jgi:hypothetical protein
METITSSMANPSGHTSQKAEGTVIWNATQHAATADQKAQGVVDLPEEARIGLAKVLTFEDLPTAEQLRIRSVMVIGSILAAGAKAGDRVMLGGAPFFMEELSHAARELGLVPVFAFSRRESVEQVLEDGTVRKVAVFRHLGFVYPETPQS